MAVAAAFLSWALLLPVVPLDVLTSGGSDALAGSTTAIFMGCSVLTQWNTPRALRRFGYTPVMVFAAIMLGVPALGHIMLDDAPFVLALSAFRGIGFGALTVAESALIAELVPKRFLGRASGLLGLAIGLAQLVGLPLGSGWPRNTLSLLCMSSVPWWGCSPRSRAFLFPGSWPKAGVAAVMTLFRGVPWWCPA